MLARLSLLFIFTICLVAPLHAADDDVPALPKLDAKQYLLVDYLSGTVLASKDAS